VSNFGSGDGPLARSPALFDFGNPFNLANQLLDPGLDSSMFISRSAPDAFSDPLHRFATDSGPWDPLLNRPASNRRPGIHHRTNAFNADLTRYRNNARSDVSSLSFGETGTFFSDSACATQTPILSLNDPSLYQQDTELSTAFENLHPSAPESVHSSNTGSRIIAETTLQTPSQRKGRVKACTLCGELPKCPSDFKLARPSCSSGFQVILMCA